MPFGSVKFTLFEEANSFFSDAPTSKKCFLFFSVSITLYHAVWSNPIASLIVSSKRLLSSEDISSDFQIEGVS